MEANYDPFDKKRCPENRRAGCFFEIMRMQKERGDVKIGSESFSKFIAIFDDFWQELFENLKHLKNMRKLSRKS